MEIFNKDFSTFLAPDGPPSNFMQYVSQNKMLYFRWKLPGMNSEYWNTDSSKNSTWFFIIYYGRMIVQRDKRVEVSNGAFFNISLERPDFQDIWYTSISSKSDGKEGNSTNITCFVAPLTYGELLKFRLSTTSHLVTRMKREKIVKKDNLII